MLVFTNCQLSDEAVHTLKSFGHTPIPCPPHPALDPAIASHPDMLVFPTRDCILTHADYIGALPALPLPVHGIGQRVGGQYPHDVLLNAARIGGFLVCRPDAVADEILQYAKQNGLTLLPVRQGYAKCNLCAVSEHAAITEDASICKALQSAGVDVLYLEPGQVALPGYPYGFIGGASGSDGTHVFFCGDLTAHPKGELIAAFCQKHQKKPISLAGHALTDTGSLLFI